MIFDSILRKNLVWLMDSEYVNRIAYSFIFQVKIRRNEQAKREKENQHQ